MRSTARVILTALFAGSLAAGAVPAAAATMFTFQFDDQGLPPGDGALSGPIVGTGTFTSPVDLAPGTYDLSSLSGFDVTFSFADGNNYSTANITTPLTGAAVRITDLGGGLERLFFTEGSGAGADGGGLGGSLDFVNGSNFLTFEPSSFGGNFLYQESNGTTTLQGRYLALSSAVPEPSTWAMMLLGFSAIGIALRTRRQRSAKPQPA